MFAPPPRARGRLVGLGPCGLGETLSSPRLQYQKQRNDARRVAPGRNPPLRSLVPSLLTSDNCSWLHTLQDEKHEPGIGLRGELGGSCLFAPVADRERIPLQRVDAPDDPPLVDIDE